MAVALGNFSRVIDLRNAGAALQQRRIGPEPHGTPHIAGQAALLQLISLHPFGHQTNDWLGRGDEFGRIGGFDAAKIPCGLDHGHLHAEANSEIRHAALTREPCSTDFSLGAALAESAWHQNAVHMLKKWNRILVLEHLAFNPVEIDFDLVGYATMR